MSQGKASLKGEWLLLALAEIPVQSPKKADSEVKLQYGNSIVNKKPWVLNSESEKFNVDDHLLKGSSSNREKIARATKSPELFLSL